MAAVYMCKTLTLSLTEESLKIERVSKHGLLSQGVCVLNTDTTFYEGHLSVPTVSRGEDILAELEDELDFQFWAGKYVWEKLKGVAKKKCSLEELKKLAARVHFDSARVEELRNEDCHKLIYEIFDELIKHRKFWERRIRKGAKGFGMKCKRKHGTTVESRATRICIPNSSRSSPRTNTSKTCDVQLQNPL